jgi:hypothetical protein
MSHGYRALAPGPFRADHIREGDPYEIVNGHAVLCTPTGRRGGLANLTGGAVLETDPAAPAAGVDIGYSDAPNHLRAPDVSVGAIPSEPGWAQSAPPLAVEYADTGQNEQDLQDKIAELLAGGTRHVWVVRLGGPRRVEIYEPGKPVRLATSGAKLLAPGILKNPVEVDALYDRDAAHEAVLRNLLQRRGYEDLDAVRKEGRKEGQEEGLRAAVRDLCDVLGIPLDAAREAALEGMDLPALDALRARLKADRRWA